MIDSRIPLMTQAVDMNAMFENGARQTELFTKMRTDGELARIYKEAGGDLGKMAELGKQSKYAQLVMPNIQSQAAAQQKAYWDQQKVEAEVGKTQSEANKNTVQTQGYSVDNNVKLLENANKALTVTAQTGDPMAAKLALNNALKAGTITPELFNQYNKQIEILGTQPEALKQFAQSILLSNDQNAMKYLQADQNTVLNAQTSTDNNIRSTQASIYSTDVSANTADKNREQQSQQFDANLYVQQNKPLDYFTAADGTRYAVYANGQGIPISNGQGAPIKAQQTTKPNTINKQLEQQDKVIAYQDAATTADEAAALARELANDVNGLNKTTGGFGIMARIPGTDARDYAQRVETLKSQVFLTQVEKMKGMGALTDAEGARLEKSIASLDINLGEDQFKKNLLEIERVLSRAANSSRQRAQLYSGGQGQQQPQNTFNLFD